MVLMLYSKKEGVRMQAARDLDRGLQKFRFDHISQEERSDIFVALFSVIDRMCWDSSADVNKESINLLLSIMQVHYKSFEKLNSKTQEKEYG